MKTQDDKGGCYFERAEGRFDLFDRFLYLFLFVQTIGDFDARI